MAAGETAGPSTALRSGRDDNSVVAATDATEQCPTPATELSSRPERTRISHFTMLARTTCAALRKESCMLRINATGLNGKSGGAQWRDLLFRDLRRVFPQPVEPLRYVVS